MKSSQNQKQYQSIFDDDGTIRRNVFRACWQFRMSNKVISIPCFYAITSVAREAICSPSIVICPSNKFQLNWIQFRADHNVISWYFYSRNNVSHTVLFIPVTLPQAQAQAHWHASFEYYPCVYMLLTPCVVWLWLLLLWCFFYLVLQMCMWYDKITLFFCLELFDKFYLEADV